MDKFMVPCTLCEDFIEFEWQGETNVVPADVEGILPDDIQIIERYQDKWFARLSAPGYMDATDWNGPHDTEEEALWDLYEMYGGSDEPFFEFIGEGKMILEGTLHLTGMRNELYGRVAGEPLQGKDWDVHLATMGDVDYDEETGETFDYDPNDDPNLPEAYEFELVDEAKYQELLQRYLQAQGKSVLEVEVADGN